MLGIILLIVGIIGLIKGKISVTRTKELRRPGSIFVSLLFIAPFPLQILVGAAMGVQAAAEGKQNIDDLQSKATMIGLAIFGICLVTGLILAFVLAKPKVPDARKRKRADYDDFDDRPRARRSDDDADEDRPRRRRSARSNDDDDEDDRPRRQDDLDDRSR